MRIDVAIIGVHKCATTSVWTALSRHSDIVTHHTGQLFGPYVDALEDGRAIECLSELRASAPDADKVLVRDTTLYDDPETLARLIRIYPEMKIILCVREPAGRAFSAFVHARNRGFETEFENFEAALERFENGTFPSRSPPLLDYFEQGFYWRHIESIRALVKDEALHVVDVESMRSDFSACCSELFRFIGVKDEPVGRVVENTRAAVKSERLNRYMRRSSLLKGVVRRCLGTRHRARLMRLVMRVNTRPDSSSTLDSETRGRLARLYAEDWATTLEFSASDEKMDSALSEQVSESSSIVRSDDEIRSGVA